MSFTVTRAGLGLPATGGPTAGEGPVLAPGASVEQVAQEFEALLLAQMVQQMRQSFLSEEEPEGGEGLDLGLQGLTETIHVELARALSKAGGIGLAEVLQRSMTRGGEPGMATPAQPVPAVTESLPEPAIVAAGSRRSSAPPGPGGSRLRLPFSAPASSDYGWRADPFHGQRRFHAGIDLKAAYGQEVPAAGAGRVVAAGDQGAYGLTVVLEHDNGVRTRYAHLSALQVQPGQEIARGTVVGRVGQSGRATGPHLHFEVLVNGQRVDPTLATGVADGSLELKLPGSGDD